MKQYDFSHFEAAKNFIKIKLYHTHAQTNTCAIFVIQFKQFCNIQVILH